MVRIFVYNKSSLLLCYEDVGLPEDVIRDIKYGRDFTLTPPPNYSQPWYWCDNAWQSEPSQSAE